MIQFSFFKIVTFNNLRYEDKEDGKEIQNHLE